MLANKHTEQPANFMLLTSAATETMFYLPKRHPKHSSAVYFSFTIGILFGLKLDEHTRLSYRLRAITLFDFVVIQIYTASSLFTLLFVLNGNYLKSIVRKCLHEYSS